jgi:hypothetical protein
MAEAETVKTMTEEFVRANERAIVFAENFPPIVALCGEGDALRAAFKSETEAGRIVLLLSANPEQAALNYKKIELADEVFMLNTENGSQYTDFQAAIFITAEKLMKHIRVLND